MERKFVGRATELQALRGAVDAAVQGRGRLLLLSGEPGEGEYVDEVHVALLEESLATWGGDEHRLHARLLARLATAIYFTGRAEERAELSARAQAHPRARWRAA